ncbi:hypothetical protein Golax_002779 [Gossypium laxum]|uniref:Uncharacterized protein n=1 Tax=Gossypium laxum TaxID=34288 RepID=A0A7J9ASH8_9ROSI|nr:hypothetical protein [Gossypium laxum]
MMYVFVSRQVSRSPHSKHSQRRHSPYSSSETTRYGKEVKVEVTCSAIKDVRNNGFHFVYTGAQAYKDISFLG